MMELKVTLALLDSIVLSGFEWWALFHGLWGNFFASRLEKMCGYANYVEYGSFKKERNF